MATRAVVWAMALSSAAANGFALWVMTLPHAYPRAAASEPAYVISLAVVSVAEIAVGSVLILLRPRNPIGRVPPRHSYAC
ncbi:hypothetical protein [Streptomyces sp. NBC_00878]|uniref:hypothetical protein n=1 Tax=Streptomyces sp. NBC_00878 TaxID=2975854 RepID=UPI00224DC366|nr:hypothetical protein [Streptomyces sp. NBC_00878]MCX4904495.1 hypothetical protein [Streptomyces sp. NBC_00878]